MLRKTPVVAFFVAAVIGSAGVAQPLVLAKAEKGGGKVASKGVKVPGQEFVKVESVRDWSMIVDDKSKLDVTLGAGLTDKSKSLVLTYDMGEAGQWVQTFKEGALGLLEGDVIAFAHKGEGKNSFEIKLEMVSGETFGILFEGESASPSWQVKEVPLTDLEYFWGGTGKTLDPARVKKIFFAVSKKPDDAGGKGILMVTSINKVSPKK